MTDYSKIAVSTRVRLARNLEGYPFPSHLKDERQAKDVIRIVTSGLARLCDFKIHYMDKIPEAEALSLKENHLISPNLITNGRPSAVLINREESVSIMINEEDHLREQCIVSGLALESAYDKMSDKDSLIAHSLPFAYDERLGYLTACPTNLGTGLRASVMMFLPAIAIGGIMPRVIQSATRLGLTVRGAYGEGSSATGYTYQISNEVTLGVNEEDIISQVTAVVDKIVEMEASERERLKKGSSATKIKDKCLRAYGVLANCALMTSEEFVNLCADLKLAACLGYANVSDISAIDDLILKMKPSNINALSGRHLSPGERDAYRASYASEQIKKLVSIN